MNKDKKVCGCFNITVGDLIDARDKGAKSIEDLKKATKVGMACGRCKEKAEITMIKVLQNRLYF